MIDDNGGIGVRLRALRAAAGISQQELAERSGLSIRAISNLERGRTRWPYRHSLKRLADSLGLTGAEREAFIAVGRRPIAAAGTPDDDRPRAAGTDVNEHR